MHLHLVWLKKDLRLSDHTPLHLAAEAARSTGGVLVLLYCLEPRLIKQPDSAPQHFEFARECLQELAAALPDHVPLFLAKANMPVALQTLLMSGVEQLSVYSHEETGNWASFERDKEVMRWCKARGVDWQEFPCNAVVRRLKNRDEWGKLWLETMRKPVLPVPVKAIPTAKLEPPFKVKALPDSITKSSPGLPESVKVLLPPRPTSVKLTPEVIFN